MGSHRERLSTTPRYERSETGWATRGADCPYPLQLACERLIKFDWRVEEEVVIREAHDRHPRSERQRQPDSTHSQVLEWSINYPDVQRYRLVYVDWLVERGNHSHLPESFL